MQGINVTTTKGKLVTGDWGDVEWGGPSVNGQNFFYREGGEEFLYKELCRLEVPIYLIDYKNYNNGCNEIRLTTSETDRAIDKGLWIDAYDLICVDMGDRTIGRLLDTGITRTSKSDSKFLGELGNIETY